MSAQYINGKYVLRVAGSGAVDAGVAGILDTANDVVVVSVEDLANMSILLNQLVDAGTCTILVEKTFDGVNWISLHAAYAETDFPAGNNKLIELTLSDTNGMPLVAKSVRATLSAVGGGGSYSLAAAGVQKSMYR